LVSAVTVRAGTINVLNMPPGETSLQLVTVGDPGNVADPDTGYGQVGYVYQMGKYDVTIGQYTAFLNAVAVNSDPYGLYNPKMASDSIGIVQTSTSAGNSYSVKGSENMPIFDVSWGDSARFVNWLANGQLTGPEGKNTTETGTYTLSGATSTLALMQVTRNPGSTWVLPNVNEWYKASFYVGGGTNAGYWTYATQSNTPPSNVLSATGTNNANFYDNGSTAPTGLTPVGAFAASPGPYGTYDMGGDVSQWNETGYGSTARGFRGGSYASGFGILLSTTNEATDPAFAGSDIGFRVAYVPEPSSLALLLAGVVGLGIWRLRRNAWGS
jgi:formylglycine-generating enzyme required for sulfatase activity